MKVKTTPLPRWTTAVDLHSFRLAQKSGLGETRLGEEVDLTIGADYRGVARFTGGLSYVQFGESLNEIDPLSDDALFVYAMTDVRF